MDALGSDSWAWRQFAHAEHGDVRRRRRAARIAAAMMEAPGQSIPPALRPPLRRQSRLHLVFAPRDDARCAANRLPPAGS